MQPKINIPYFSIRLLTLACYFLPFIFFFSTCTDDINSKNAFNKTDAIANEQERYDFDRQKIDLFVMDTNTTNRNEAFV